MSNISVDGENNDPNKYAWIQYLIIDGVPVYEGTTVTMAGEVSAAQLMFAGSATFAGIVTATTFSGDLTGNVTGDVTGNSDT